MLFTFSALPVFLLITALLCLALAVAALVQGRTPFTRYYAGLMLASTAYAAGYGLELASPDLAAMRAMLRIQYLGIPFVPYCWIGLAYSYLEPAGLPRRWNALLLVVAIAMLIIPQSNGLHHLYYVQLDYVRLDGLAIAHSRKGALYWVNIAYLNIGAACGVMLLFRAWRQAIPLYRRQALLLLLGSLLPWGFHLIYQSGGAPRGIDISPFGIAATGLAFAIATMRHQVLDILPRARDLVLDGMAEGVIVLDTRRRIVDFNRAATRLMPGLGLGAIGAQCEAFVALGEEGTFTPQLLDIGARRLEIRCDALQDRRDRRVGAVLLLRDVSEKLALVEELRQLAMTDGLTGCYNRRHLFELCQHALSAARRYGRPLSLIILDIDDFKTINDQRGHLAGDRLLGRVCEILRHRLRATDILGRYGGDEFIVILPETTGADALRTAECLAEDCAAGSDVHLSLGVAEFVAEDGLESLLTRADLALYRAKHAGKNRAVLDAAPNGDAATSG
jgi:diguanylate cyclase (GGDEF)-like protein